MISFAQNFEDVILQRALSKVVSGYYIDIGAQEPIVDSVSNHFYSSGWSGINVEPVPSFARALREARPRDVIVEKAITSTVGPIEMFEIEQTGLSTLLGSLSEKYVAQGRISNKLKVETMTLDALLDTITEEEVHWMKIDVEGSEESTLKSWQKSQIRPWIVVVEATEPTTQIPSYKAWEGILLGKDYSHVYSDGLNRFYLHKNHSELRDSFVIPPNIFDDFELSGKGSQPFTYMGRLIIYKPPIKIYMGRLIIYKPPIKIYMGRLIIYKPPIKIYMGKLIIYKQQTRAFLPTLIIYKQQTRAFLPTLIIYKQQTRAFLPTLIIYKQQTRAFLPTLIIYKM